MSTDQYTYFLQAIREHSGMELASIRSAGEHGADTGWPGFTYTSDGEDFYRKHQREIVEMLGEDAEEFGFDNVAAFVASFARANMTDVDGGYECLCAWYVLETVGRMASDRLYERTH